MNNKYKIITDSCCNLSEDYIKKYDLDIMSLFFNTKDSENKAYVKGEKFDYEKFYALLRSKETITTSLPNLESSAKLCESFLSKGKDVIYISFSSGLSGTYNALSVLFEELREKYPDRKAICVDSLSAAGGQGLLVCHACELRQQGKTIDELHQWVLDNRLNYCHWVIIDDLFFLLRGGRISAATAIGGSILSVKPIIYVNDDGKLINSTSVRGRRKVIDAVVDKMPETMPVEGNNTVFIYHGDCLKDAEYAAERIRGIISVKEVVVDYLEPVMASHAGPGTIAIFFQSNNREYK